MVTQSTIVDQILGDAASAIYGLYAYISTGTGTIPFNNSSVDLTSGTETNSAGFNKVRDTTSTGSFVNGREMVILFNLEPDEPITQPVTLGEIGLMKTLAQANSMGIGALFNVTQLKDNTVKHRYRATLRMNRVDEFGNEEV